MIFANYDLLDNIDIYGYQTFNQVILSGRPSLISFLVEYVILLLTHGIKVY